MTSKSQQDIIAVELFEYITDYTQELEANKASITDAIDGDHMLVLFSQNFLEQFSKGYLSTPISGFNDRSRRQLRQRRRTLEKGQASAGDKTEAGQKLIFHLEPMCDRISEISYGNSEIDAEEFHYVFFAELLELIVAWLEETSKAGQELRDTAQASLEAYQRAIA